jgi:acyl-CoA synthetase (AMP-forming)/AMP-acid ligase II
LTADSGKYSSQVMKTQSTVSTISANGRLSTSRSRRQEHATTAPFDSAAARVATLLDKAGIEPGDRVGVMLPNTAAFAIAFYGIDWSQ